MAQVVDYRRETESKQAELDNIKSLLEVRKGLN